MFVMKMFRFLQFLLMCFIFVDASCPNILTKKQWDGRKNEDIEYIIIPVKNVIIHHTVSNPCNTTTKCTDIVKNIQAYHMDSLQYHDIGYNFLIGEDGNIYEGVGWHRVGAHTLRWNSKSIGIAFIGDFSDNLPNEDALTALKNLLKCGIEKNELSDDYNLFGAKQLSATQSPGTRLYQEIVTWNHFSTNIKQS